MDLAETLHKLVQQSQANGFDFQRWYQIHIQLTWPGLDAAVHHLSLGSRYYALLFSHDFARCYWKTGERISFAVPTITYPRVNSRGEVILVTRKPFTRRTTKPDAWKYHIRQMAASEDALAYMARFLPTAPPKPVVRDYIVPEAEPAPAEPAGNAPQADA